MMRWRWLLVFVLLALAVRFHGSPLRADGQKAIKFPEELVLVVARLEECVGPIPGELMPAPGLILLFDRVD